MMGEWGKGQKIVHNDKTNLSDSVSQELYLTWLWFLVDMCILEKLEF